MAMNTRLDREGERILHTMQRFMHGKRSCIMQLEKRFKVIWADHGDMLSTQYAGTGALKSGFTRTGQRTPLGLIDDGLKSCVRYYLNNFEDGQKQDAYDLVTGAFQPGKVCVQPAPWTPVPSWACRLQVQYSSVVGPCSGCRIQHANTNMDLPPTPTV
jgi:hypothetical protein